ncbi:MAG: TIR domain-containing protein [Arcobacter sp.]|uniref:TIR domain-containing protein n=1 Tax=Arcobacter sp. TaxID=1872629 RepID=UPI003D038C19
MIEEVFGRYKELIELAIKVRDSTYTSKGEISAGFKYVDKDLYNSWRYQTKSFIHEYLGNNSIYFNEFEKIDNAKGLSAGTNFNKFEKQYTILTALENDIRRLVTKKEIIKDTVVKNTSEKKKVFIVHGHDELAISQVSDVLRKLKLEPIILRDQASQSSTVIEKIEKYTDDVDFGIILYTECDIGGKDINSLQSRARQNVVLEHGFLMARLGRKNTMALVKGKVETPSDINGVVYTPMDNHNAWQYKLADELKQSGYIVSKDDL